MSLVESAYPRDKLSQAEYNNIISDFKKWCSEGVLISDKKGDVVPFTLNEAQEDFARVFFRAYFAIPQKPVEIISLKARQIGITTLVAAIIAYTCTLGSNKRMDVGYVMPDHDSYLEFMQRKFQPLLEGLHPSLLPEVRISKKGSFLFIGYTDGEALSNKFYGISSNSRAAGRGRMIRGLVLDEYASYEKAVNLERGIMATVPKTGRSFKIIVSTANGMDHFYKAYKNAKKENNWVALFYPWHYLSEYEMEAKEFDVLTDYQEQLLEEFQERGYPVESWGRKLAWYEYMLANEAGGDQDYMFQEYPSFEDEAFLSSGRPAFPLKKIIKLEEDSKKHHVQNGRAYVYADTIIDPDNPMGVGLVPSEKKTPLKIFDMPELSRQYIIGVDPADGGEHSDFSALAVMDVQKLTIVASYRARTDQHELAELAVALARDYNNARLIPERNTGGEFINWAKKKLGYHRIFSDQTFKTIKGTNLGVYMTQAARNSLIGDLKFLLNNDLYTDYDDDFWEECKAFVYNDTKGKFQASSGKSDDVVMSRVLCMAGINVPGIAKKHNIQLTGLK